MPHGITQCYLPPGRGDIPALTPAEAGTRLSDPGGMQGGVDTHPGTNRARRALTSFMRRTPLTTTPRRQPLLPLGKLLYGARQVVPCVHWPAAGITVHIL